jgi:hypothetical protein
MDPRPPDAAPDEPHSMPEPAATAAPGPGTRPPQVKLDFASGGWVLLLAGVLGVWLLLHLTWPLLTGQARPQPTQATPEQLGFDLSNCSVPRDQIVYGARMDSIPPLTNPPTVQGSAVDGLNLLYRHKYHHKFVVTGDRVVGVTLNGESRAYQLKVLQWHEVVNDTLGGVPIAVTYSPLSDSVVVFDRRVGSKTEVFASSGLLYNSNTLLTDQQQAGASAASLWSQLGRKALSGWAAGQELTPLPCELTHWGDWYVRHPETTLLSTDTGAERDYTQNAYGPYFDRRKLRFPVQPQLPAGSLVEPFARGVAYAAGGAWEAYSYPAIAGTAQPADLPAEAAVALGPDSKPDPARAPEAATVDGRQFIYEPEQAGMEPPTVRLAAPDGQPCVYGLWWALYAFGYVQ